MQTDGFRELVRLAQAADPEAVERFYREVSAYVEGVVRAKGVAPGESVRDRANDTCLRILSRLSQFRGASEAPDDEQALRLFCGWVDRVAHSVMANGDRRRRRQRPVVSLQFAGTNESADDGGIDPPGPERTSSSILRADERARLIQAAIDSLPDPTDREIVRRRFFEEQSLEAIAEALALTYDQVRYRSEKSLKRLQPRLEGLR